MRKAAAPQKEPPTEAAAPALQRLRLVPLYVTFFIRAKKEGVI